ncbi:hypothetical protein MPHO_32480 [Mycolicibacterium phocaicum]|nr:hypothetical protein MPHO_32480 [Mycolicibacterium phocaicum]
MGSVDVGPVVAGSVDSGEAALRSVLFVGLRVRVCPPVAVFALDVDVLLPVAVDAVVAVPVFGVWVPEVGGVR